MPFRFETANERWKFYKHSIMEHFQHTPDFGGLGAYTQDYINPIKNPDGSKRSPFDNLRTRMRRRPLESDDRFPALMYDKDYNEYYEGEDFIYSPDGEVLIRDPQSQDWVPDRNNTLFPDRYETAVTNVLDRRKKRLESS